MGRPHIWRRPLDHHDKAWTNDAVLTPLHWQWGELEITPDDIRFVDVERHPTEHFAPAFEQIDRTILFDPVLREMMKECFEATQALCYVCNNDLKRQSDGLNQSPGWSGGAALAADMRDFGEHYCDLALWVGDYDEDKFYDYRVRIYERLSELGWEGPQHGPVV